MECTDTQANDGGSRYTVKEYQSFKALTELSNEDNEHRYRVVGEFLGVIG